MNMDTSKHPSALVAGLDTARSANLFDAACKLIPGGVNSTARATWSGWNPYPLFVERGQGSRLTDVDGNEYIDYLLGLGPMIFGHRPPRVTQAVVDFIQDRGTVFALPTADEARLARKIVDAVPSVEQVRLCNTGTEAVLYATRLARAFTKRTKIVRFEGMYHGFSDGVYWSKHPSIAKAGPDDHPVPVPQGPGMPKGVEDNLIILPWNDAQALADTIAREGDSIAAVLTEPVMCNTGCILPQPGYLEAMRELTARHGIVLIFDEVITGFGRLGKATASEYFGVTPDIITMAKAINNAAVPMGGVAVSRAIHDTVVNGGAAGAIELFHGYTYSAHPLAAAALIATQDLYRREGLFERAHSLAPKFEAAAHALRDAKHVKDVRNLGLVAGIELESRDGAPGARAYEVFVKCFEAGVLIRFTGDILAFSPPLIVTEEEIERLFGTVRDVLAKVQ